MSHPTNALQVLKLASARVKLERARKALERAIDQAAKVSLPIAAHLDVANAELGAALHDLRAIAPPIHPAGGGR